MVRKILIWPNETLNEVSQPVIDPMDPHIQILVRDMIETMRAHRGIGLAAIQLGVPLRIFVMEERGWPGLRARVCINPVVQDRAFQRLTEEKSLVEEGCLSLPGVYEAVRRYDEVVLDCQHVQRGISETEPEKGVQPILIEGRLLMQGQEAQCAQHEMDHLDGKIFVGDVGPVKRDIIKRKIKKALRERE